MSTKSLLAFVFGAAAGEAATYFLTSEKTAGTREQVKAKVKEGLEPVKEKFEEKKEEFSEKMGPVKQKILEGLNKAEEALNNI